MPEYLPVTSTSEYGQALIELQRDIPKYIKATGLQTEVTVRIPKPLVELIFKRGENAYNSVKKGLTNSLGQFCAIGHWSMGQDENGENYIHFKLLPERVRDGD